jgi:phenylacetate-CoA ligase
MTKSTVKNISRLHGYWIHKNLLSRTPYWPADRRDEYVLSHLRQTLVRAGEGTPFYRKLFREAGFDPQREFKTPEDLSKIPLLTKDDVRANFREMLDPRYQRLSFTSQTSGSTGQPMQMVLNEYYSAFDSACLFRHWSWARYKFRDPFVALRSYVPKNDGEPLWRYSRLQNTLYFSAYHLTPKNCNEYLDAILEFQPQFLRGYPSSVVVLAEYAYPVRERFAGLKGVFTASETLLATERETIERTFGKKLFDWYGMTEPVLAICECEAHQGMHINWDYGYAEFLPSDDLPPHEYRLVATGFHNPVMPFIRYDTGDIVRLFETPRKCPCGRNMPLVESISGRKDECIITPDGRRLPSLNFYSVFREFSDVLRFQIVQYGRSEIVVKLLFRPEAADVQGQMNALRGELRARMGREVDLSLEVTDRFLTNPDGKTLPVLRRVGTRAVEEGQEYATSLQSLKLAWQLERQGQEVYKLDWNEAERVPSRRVRDVLRDAIENDHYTCWYPDPDNERLLQAISEYVDVPSEHIVLAHGSDLALDLVASAFNRPGDKVLIVSPNYDHFRAMAERRGAEILMFEYWGDTPFPCDAFATEVARLTPRLVYLTNPNNPIGYALPLSVLGRLAAECSRLASILILDEAYYEFCGITGAALVTKYSHCIVTRSFSKAFGMAGLRLGYLLAPLEIGRVLKRLNISKSVTMLAKAAALAALQDLESVRSYVEEIRRAKEQFYALFQELGIAYQASLSNFITFEHNRAAEIVKYLGEKRILVRDGSRYSRGKGCVRLTVSGTQSTEVVIQTLREYFSTCESGLSSGAALEADIQPSSGGVRLT